MATVPDFLKHLRVDARGRPVPWINAWGKEDPATVRIEYDPYVRGPGVFIPDVGDVPDFTRQSPQRQRRAVVEGLCQVCGKPVPWSRRFLVVSSISTNPIDLDGRRVVVLTEPWLDERCGTFAVERCPGLIRRRRDEDLRILPVTSKTQVRYVASRGWIEGPLEALSRRELPAMWCKIQLLATQIDVIERAAQ